jgi:tRNA(Ile)-lysidine synthase TilS/MesJ
MKSCLNYSKWKEDNKVILQSLRDKNVIMMYTGGKDGSAALYFFWKASKEFNFKFQTHAILFPKHVFIPDEVETLDNYWREKSISITWHKTENTDKELENAIEDGLNPCTICRKIKRRYWFGYLSKNINSWQSLIIVVNYSLWDLVSYTLEQILGTIYCDSVESSSAIDRKNDKDRFLQTSQRFYPFFSLKEGYSIFKPLLRYNDTEILEVVAENKIPISSAVCEYKYYLPKRLFADCYEKLEISFNYDKVFEFAKNFLSLHDPSTYSHFNKEDFFSNIL